MMMMKCDERDGNGPGFGAPQSSMPRCHHCFQEGQRG